MDVFIEPSSPAESVASAGEDFLLALYAASKDTLTLNKHRHHCFLKAVAKCPIHSKIKLEALPPTSEAARQHSLRTYHQVQHWLGNELPPGEWGWDLVNGQFHPVLTRQPPAPPELLRLISCNCKCGCERACGCRKAGLRCSVLCGQCRGSGCANSDIPEVDEDSNHLMNEDNDHERSDDSSNEDEDVRSTPEQMPPPIDQNSGASSSDTAIPLRTRKRKLVTE